jgi:hypothetical protein
MQHTGGVADRLLAGLNDYFAIEDRIESPTTARHQRD